MMGIKEVTYYQVTCDKCGYNPFTEGMFEYGAFADKSDAVDQVIEALDWFHRSRLAKVLPPDDSHPYERHIYKTVELLCPKCQKCEICGEPGYEAYDKLRCETHEGGE